MALNQQQEEAVETLKRAYGALKLHEQAYEKALMRCGELKIPNTHLGRVVGVSEVAIRGWLKRRNVVR